MVWLTLLKLWEMLKGTRFLLLEHADTIVLAHFSMEISQMFMRVRFFKIRISEAGHVREFCFAERLSNMSSLSAH